MINKVLVEPNKKPDIGDRVRLISSPKETGTIDDIWHDGVEMFAVVWDKSGCIGEGPVDDLELIPDDN